MSDFFTHLAERARGATDVVRPRLPSRFETAESAPAPQPNAPLETVIELEMPEVAPARVQPASRAAGDDAPHAAPRARSEPRTSEPSAVPQAVPAQPVRPPSRGITPRDDTATTFAAPAAAAPPVPVASPFERPAAARVEPRISAQAEAPRDRAVEPRVRRDAAALAPDAVAAPRRDAARERRTTEPERGVVQNAVRAIPEIVPVAARVAAGPPAPAIVPRVVRALPERAPQPSAPRAAETTVHVSIGRIEVRATPPPAERRRDAAAPAVMSLGEYLRSRTERAR